MSKPCRCGHTWFAHRHYHAGTYCAYGHQCGCRKYRRPWRWRILAMLTLTLALTGCGPTPPPHLHCTAGQCRPAP